jgi:hypothetical protein
MTGLTFDEASHTYRINGLVVPGVTSILKPLTDFDSVPAGVLQAASEFGTAVHLACELDDLGELDDATLDPALVPYLAAWRKFIAEHRVEWELIEARVYNKTLRYAGTVDRCGYVNGAWAVVDIKSTAQLYPSVGPQLAAYAGAIDGSFGLSQRFAVQLKGDGTYTLKQYTDPTDWPVFCSLLTLRNWCARHCITPNLKG